MEKHPETSELATAMSNDNDISPAPQIERITVKPKGTESDESSTENSPTAHKHGLVELRGPDPADQPPIQTTADELDKKKGKFGYLKTKQFWIVLALTQALAVSDTGTNTLTTLLAQAGTSIPAFQSLFNYVLLNLIYTSYTIYKYGFKGWLKLMYRDGWKFFLLSFCDVEGNYFTVLAYRYTTILSAQLIEFWAIAVVVAISLIFLRVRYHFFQYVGILICVGGLGMMIASDHLAGTNGGFAPAPVKGDLFCLLGATFYGLSNVFEEFLLSKRPIYEVVGQLAWWGMIINGVQAAIFDKDSFRGATWDGQVAGYLVGYTLILTYFYSTAPVVFRMSSAAFFNIGLLTGNFWGLIVGLRLFHLHVHWMYPVAFVLIIGGHFVYYGTEGVLGEARKPWLGKNQEGGDDGVGTARRKLEHPEVIV